MGIGLVAQWEEEEFYSISWFDALDLSNNQSPSSQVVQTMYADSSIYFNSSMHPPNMSAHLKYTY